MNTALTCAVSCADLDETLKLGRQLGANLRGGEIIELTGDLGSGKTSLTTGIAAGAGSTDHVASPSFTISKVYQTNTFNISHFDFYRLNDSAMIAFELHDALEAGDVVVLEWADSLRGVLPADRLLVRVTPTVNGRNYKFTATKETQYLLEGLC